MFLTPFVSQDNSNKKDGEFTISRQQGSDFAKQLANDFNPLHDVSAKRFVVPGDLLFSWVLTQQGLFANMAFEFNSMLSADTVFTLDSQGESGLLLQSAGKECLSVEYSGQCSQNSELIESIARAYVKFSGETFPHILVPLMQQQDVMINPARPMVMYQSMKIQWHDFNATDVKLEIAQQDISMNGKRADVNLQFNFTSAGKVVGQGQKSLLLSGLRPYNDACIQGLVNDYEAHKATYNA